MSVRKSLLAVTDEELAELIAKPQSVLAFIDSNEPRILALDNYDQALSGLLCEGPEEDFLDMPPAPEGGVLGAPYELDMGYGPPWYCKHSFLERAVEKIGLGLLERDAFAACCGPDQLNEWNVYPGYWTATSFEFLVDRFQELKAYVLQAIVRENHLIVWCH